jgi:hypothetical protein
VTPPAHWRVTDLGGPGTFLAMRLRKDGHTMVCFSYDGVDVAGSDVNVEFWMTPEQVRVMTTRVTVAAAIIDHPAKSGRGPRWPKPYGGHRQRPLSTRRAGAAAFRQSELSGACPAPGDSEG